MTWIHCAGIQHPLRRGMLQYGCWLCGSNSIVAALCPRNPGQLQYEVAFADFARDPAKTISKINAFGR
jgi:hypothetical protein